MDSELRPEHLMHKLADLVRSATEPQNAVLVDQSRLIKWVGPSFALFAVPLATVCMWLSHHTEQLAAQRILILQRRLRLFRRP